MLQQAEVGSSEPPTVAVEVQLQVIEDLEHKLSQIQPDLGSKTVLLAKLRLLRQLENNNREQIRNEVLDENGDSGEASTTYLSTIFTPYGTSFASRLYGRGTRSLRSASSDASELDHVHCRLPVHNASWYRLMQDIQLHWCLKNAKYFGPVQSPPCIDFVPLQDHHLDQVHEILQQMFWPGIDVSAAAVFDAHKCTVVAKYRQLVVGVALISPPPDEGYITYFAVRKGWTKCGIGRTMLFLLVKLNSERDILLHVSADNTAMLLYNQFGFKAEEFISGFYKDYADHKNRSSSHALRLRLRQT